MCCGRKNRGIRGQQAESKYHEEEVPGVIDRAYEIVFDPSHITLIGLETCLIESMMEKY